MKEIKGKISILFGEDGLRIEVKDPKSAQTFLKIKLDQQQTCEALSRIAYTECVMEANGLDRVGKKMEIDTMQFSIPERDKDLAIEMAIDKCPDGWEVVPYFNSKDSFQYKNSSKNYQARCTIRRWVDV